MNKLRINETHKSGQQKGEKRLIYYNLQYY